MDLVLNNQQRLICYKTQTNKQLNTPTALAHSAQVIIIIKATSHSLVKRTYRSHTISALAQLIYLYLTLKQTALIQ